MPPADGAAGAALRWIAAPATGRRSGADVGRRVLRSRAMFRCSAIAQNYLLRWCFRWLSRLRCCGLLLGNLDFWGIFHCLDFLGFLGNLDFLGGRPGSSIFQFFLNLYLWIAHQHRSDESSSPVISRPVLCFLVLIQTRKNNAVAV